MNREIKFRLWTGKKMVPMTAGLMTAATFYPFGFKGATSNPNKFVMLQFTGLHDKNGKEIYNGDLITEGHSTIYEVRYTPPQFRLFCVRKPIQSHTFSRWTDQFSEIIGNIYENRELIKEAL